MWLWIVFAVVVLVGFTALTGAPYVPSKRRDLRVAFTELYALSRTDTLVDIGSGDGVVLRMARRFGAHAIGYELHPILVIIARILSLRDRETKIYLANFWHRKLPRETTVVYTFGEDRDIAKMYARVQDESNRLRKPLAFISYGFAVKGITPAKKVGAHYLYQIRPLQPEG